MGFWGFGARGELLEEQKKFREGIKAQVEFLEKPLVESLKIPAVNYVTGFFAGPEGGPLTLASQLFGLDHILDSADHKVVFVKETDSTRISEAIMAGSDKYDIRVDKDSRYEDANQLIITDRETGESFKTDFEIVASKNVEEMTLADYLLTADSTNHGINNTIDEAYRNGHLNLGWLSNVDEDDVGFFVLSNSPTHGLIPDMIENTYNTITGLFPFGSYLKSANTNARTDFRENQAEILAMDNITLSQSDMDYLGRNNIGNINILGYDEQSQTSTVERNSILNYFRFGDHSNGNDSELYGFQTMRQPNTTLGEVVQVVVPPAFVNSILGLVEEDPKIGDQPFHTTILVNNKEYKVPGAFYQGYGGSSRTQTLGETAAGVGVWMDHTLDSNNEPDYSVGHRINQYDPVPNIMGANAFNDKSVGAGFVEFGGSLVRTTTLGFQDLSRHGTYHCPSGSLFCGGNNGNVGDAIRRIQIDYLIEKGLISN